MIVWANVVPNRAVIKSHWIKFRQSVHLVILIVKVSCSTSVDGIKNSIRNQCTPTQYTKRRDLGVGEDWEEKLKCVDGGGDEEEQNNCKVVRIEKKKTSNSSTLNCELDSIQKEGPIIPRYTTHNVFVTGYLLVNLQYSLWHWCTSSFWPQ